MTEGLSVRILSIVDEIMGVLICQLNKPVFVIINLCKPNTIQFLILLSSLGSLFSGFALALAGKLFEKC